MINKIMDFEGLSNEGEAIVTILNPDNHSKIAGLASPIQKFWGTLTKSPIYVYVHVIAMTAGEWYGPNKRGDYFREEDLRTYHDQFVTQAKVFKHHNNTAISPTYGDVLYSYYNEEMHRIELVLQISRVAAPDVVEKMKNNENICVSMGVRVKADKCSVCGHVSPTPAMACSHIKTELLTTYPDGRLVFMESMPPFNFFDISIVHRPADALAWGLQKVATATNIPIPYSESTSMKGEEHYLLKEAYEYTGAMAYLFDKYQGLAKLGSEPEDQLIGKIQANPELVNNITPGDIGEGISAETPAVDAIKKPNPNLGDMVYAALLKMQPEEPTMEDVVLVINVIPDVFRTLSESPDNVADLKKIIEGIVEDELNPPSEEDKPKVAFMAPRYDNETEKVQQEIARIKSTADGRRGIRRMRGVSNFVPIDVIDQQSGQRYQTNNFSIREARKDQSLKNTLSTAAIAIGLLIFRSPILAGIATFPISAGIIAGSMAKEESIPYNALIQKHAGDSFLHQYISLSRY